MNFSLYHKEIEDLKSELSKKQEVEAELKEYKEKYLNVIKIAQDTESVINEKIKPFELKLTQKEQELSKLKKLL